MNDIKKFATEFAGFMEAVKRLAEIDNLEEEYAAAKHRVDVVRSHAADVIAQGDHVLAEAQLEGQRIIETARAACDQMMAAVERDIKSAKEHAEAELAQVKEASKRFEAQLAIQRQHADDMQTEIAARRDQLTKLEEAIAEKTGRHDELKAELAKIRLSLGA